MLHTVYRYVAVLIPLSLSHEPGLQHHGLIHIPETRTTDQLIRANTDSQFGPEAPDKNKTSSSAVICLDDPFFPRI